MIRLSFVMNTIEAVDPICTDRKVSMNDVLLIALPQTLELWAWIGTGPSVVPNDV